MNSENKSIFNFNLPTTGLLILMCICCFWLLSCEKDSNLETPEFTPRLVVHSFISPQDTMLLVNVSTNKNVFGKRLEYQRNLPFTVTMIDGDKEVVFSKFDTLGSYTARYQVYAGREYTLKVKCTGYSDVLATTRIPLEKSIVIQLDTVTELVKFPWGEYYTSNLQVKFNDFPGEKNFYNIHAHMQYVSSSYGISAYNLAPVQENHSWLLSKIVSDNLLDGKSIITNFTFDNYTSPDLLSKEIKAYVLHTDEAYYKYHNSLKKYSGTDDPFTEFSPVYSNISGGYGIFASYVKHVKLLKIK